jgi:hypothetical protein
MARQTNGTNQSLQTASALAAFVSPSSAVSVWLWVDSYAGGTELALEYSTDVGAGDGFLMFPNPGSGRFEIQNRNGGGITDVSSFARPSAAAWHHYVLNFGDVTGVQLISAYVDGSSVSLTRDATGIGNSSAFGSKVLYLLARANTSLWTAGRIAEVAIWDGVNFAQGDVDALYNSGAGALATNVQSGTLKYYCRLLGDVSPEPSLVGGIDMTVNGATQAAHPFSDAPPPDPTVILMPQSVM